MNNTTNKLLLSILVALLVVASFFGWLIYSDTKAEDLSLREESSENIETEKNSTQPEEDISRETEMCLGDIEEANVSTKELYCTLSLSDIRCPYDTQVYTASNGCITNALKEKGWEEVSHDKEDI